MISLFGLVELGLSMIENKKIVPACQVNFGMVSRKVLMDIQQKLKDLLVNTIILEEVFLNFSKQQPLK